MQFSELTGIVGGKTLQLGSDRAIDTLVTDSRKPVVSDGSLFLAMKGERHDGHAYLPELYTLGLRQFVVESEVTPSHYPGANIILVSSTRTALLKLAAFHRRQFNVPVIGITGSNGKTTIKEWLFQVFSPDFTVIKNPGSYNSQIGVPLSVWGMTAAHNLAIFEAGISTTGEMDNLRSVMQPTIGLFTNIGSAHDEGFSSLEEKADEKAKLFVESKVTVYCRDHQLVHDALQRKKIKTLSWGTHAEADIRVITKGDGRYGITYKGLAFEFILPFDQPAFRENALHLVAMLLERGYAPAIIQERISQLRPIPMRLQLKQGIQRSTLIDDSYNNDLAGLTISLDFLRNLQKGKKIVILSDLLQTGLPPEELLRKIKTLIAADGVTEIIGIGPVLYGQRQFFPGGTFFQTTDDFLNHVDLQKFADSVVLIKGARPFEFERIVNRLQRKVHGTVMEIDLTAMIHNLNYFKSMLKPGTKLMGMVKAFAYGSGSEEVANLLQYHRIDYLGVAFADEGVELRKNNITVPIMVMNPTEESFDVMLGSYLEPEVYSLRLLNGLLDFLNGRRCQVHLKMDTGMHRLGFEEGDLDKLGELLRKNSHVKVASIFTHLSGADESAHDSFSGEQCQRFATMADRMDRVLGYRPLRHMLNSPGILRFPQFQFDMVRLGIGLYGIDPTEAGNANLKPAVTLKTVLSQIRKVRAGETVGYGRRGKADADMTLATLAIGYADGFSRSFSNGKGKVLIHGRMAPVVGNVCMDMTMVDITGISAEEGDEAIIFGGQLPIQQVAQWIGTIPYELLTSTSERVKRVFYAESI